MEREWAKPSLRVKTSSSWGDGLEIFNDLLLLARRKNTGSSEAKMWVQHLDDVIQYHAGSRQAEREMS
jgi:hypothetical protein